MRGKICALWLYMSELFANYWMVAIKLALALATAVIFLKMFNINSQLKQLTPISVVLNFLLSAILSSFILDSEFTIMDFFVIMIIYGLLLAAALRAMDVHSLRDIKFAQVEANGDLTIVKKGDENYSVVLIDNIAQYHHGKMQVIKKK